MIDQIQNLIYSLHILRPILDIDYRLYQLLYYYSFLIHIRYSFLLFLNIVYLILLFFINHIDIIIYDLFVLYS